MLVCKEVGICGGLVDSAVVLQGVIRVSRPWVRAPEHILTFQRGCLGVGEMEDGHLLAIGVDVNT